MAHHLTMTVTPDGYQLRHESGPIEHSFADTKDAIPGPTLRADRPQRTGFLTRLRRMFRPPFPRYVPVTLFDSMVYAFARGFGEFAGRMQGVSAKPTVTVTVTDAARHHLGPCYEELIALALLSAGAGTVLFQDGAISRLARSSYLGRLRAALRIS